MMRERSRPSSCAIRKAQAELFTEDRVATHPRTPLARPQPSTPRKQTGPRPKDTGYSNFPTGTLSKGEIYEAAA